MDRAAAGLVAVAERRKWDRALIRVAPPGDRLAFHVRSRVLALASRQREEELVAPGERYSVEQRTAEIEALVAAQERVSFATLLGDAPTIGFAVVTFIALLDLYRRGVIDLAQDELFADIVITRREATSAQI